MSTCPTCSKPITMAAVENPRNGKWTALPLDELKDFDRKGTFKVGPETHEAVDMLGQSVGILPIAVYVKASTEFGYAPHPPSHFLGDVHGG